MPIATKQLLSNRHSEMNYQLINPKVPLKKGFYLQSNHKQEGARLASLGEKNP